MVLMAACVPMGVLLGLCEPFLRLLNQVGHQLQLPPNPNLSRLYLCAYLGTLNSSSTTTTEIFSRTPSSQLWRATSACV